MGIMKNFVRRAAMAAVATVAAAGLVAVSAPASQANADTGWGCGGACRVITTR